VLKFQQVYFSTLEVSKLKRRDLLFAGGLSLLAASRAFTQGTAPSPRAQPQPQGSPQARLLEALRANRLPLTMSGGPAGRGWDWLVKKGRDARFTLIGEAQLSAALFSWRRVLPRESDIIEFASKDKKLDTRPASLAGILPAVVALFGGDTGHGSAFLLTKDGLALTNFHVVQGQQTLTARFENGTERPVRIVRVDSVADLALVEVFCATDCSTVSLGAEGFPATGTEVYAIGTPVSRSFDHTVTKGIVSALRRRGSITLLQTDAAVNPGNSGGPLVDVKSGNVVGVITLKVARAGVEGLGFAISIDDALRTLGLVRRKAR
jgi:S1-C subfamily serine protease